VLLAVSIVNRVETDPLARLSHTRSADSLLIPP
jgi:hypothetical protein